MDGKTRTVEFQKHMGIRADIGGVAGRGLPRTDCAGASGRGTETKGSAQGSRGWARARPGAAPRCCARASNFQSWNAACHRLARSLQFGRQRTGCTRPRQGGARRRCARAEGGEAALGPEGDRPPPLWGCVGCRARPTRAARDKSSEQGLNLSGSWQQGHSAAYNTPFLIQVVCK